MYYGLVSNVISVLFLCGVVIWLELSLNKKYSHYILGVIFGLITIFVMYGRITVAEGRFYDFRLITMTMAGFIGGPITAALAAIISSLYRYYAGGSGSMGGITSIIFFACFGIILGRHLKSKQNGKKPLLWFLIGILMACISLFIAIFIPPMRGNSTMVFRIVAVPFLIITPLATTIIFNFYFWTYEFFGKTSILNTLINYSPISLMIFDAQGPILFSKTLKTQHQSYPYIENPNLLLNSDRTWLNTTNQLRKEIATVDGRHFVTDLSSFQMPSGEYACAAIVNDITDQKRDITERELAHEELIKSQKEMLSILESMTDCFFTVDRNLHYTYVNNGAEIVFGKSRDQLLGKKMTEVFKINDTALQHYHDVMNEKRPVTFEVISEALGNKWIDATAYPTEAGVSCYFRDITSRKLAEETLLQSEEKFSKAFHGGPIMMALATVKEGKFIDANEAFCSGTGYTHEDIIGRTAKELNFFVDTDKRQRCGKKLMEQSRLENEELDFRTKLGEIRQGLSWSQLFYLDEQPCHITGLVDITDQKHVQKEMAKLDRLNLIGQMAASIAHEVRNPMTTVRGYLQLLGSKPEYEAKKSTFELMISELDRANAIITEFLSLSQTKETRIKPQNLNDIINDLYPLLEADTFTQDKQISFIPGNIPNINLDEQEISQLVLNLTRNGLEAMLERGSLTIKTYLQGDLVVLAIADEGCGILPEYISKLGTPFFTTKDTGTGLGLASCYKIAESHNAKVHIESNPCGTTFFIIFPVLT
ncbi:MAG: PAS domain S-box protein [Desulfosporosinus sp.]|nr:PAS domain S-box protein [Desulfosporosinus sp.]